MRKSSCRQAIDILDQVPAEFEENERYRFERGAVFETLGRIHAASDRPDRAVDSYRQAIDLWSRMIARDQRQVDLRLRVVNCTARLAPILVKLDRWDDAEKMLDRGDSTCQVHITGATRDPRIDREWVEILNQRGLVYLHKARETEALEQFTIAERVQKGIVHEQSTLIRPNSGIGEDTEHLIVTLINKAKAYLAGNRPADTEKALNSARDLAEQLRTDFPATIRYQDLAATILDALAELIQTDRKRIREARKLLEKSLSIREKYAAGPSAMAEYTRRLADTCGRLSDLFLREKSLSGAEAFQRKELFYTARLEAEHPRNLEFRFEYGRSLHNLAEFLRARPPGRGAGS